MEPVHALINNLKLIKQFVAYLNVILALIIINVIAAIPMLRIGF